jgi:hypothetical protein
MIDLELLSSALTIVIGDVMLKPKIEVDNGSVKIIYDYYGTTFTELTTTFEVEHCMRLDFLVEKIRLNAKYGIYNNLSMRHRYGKL